MLFRNLIALAVLATGLAVPEMAIASGNFSSETPSPITLSAINPAAATRGVVFNLSFGSSGGTTPITWSISGLPAGLTYSSSTGAISGSPTALGVFTVTVTATDSNTDSDSESFTLTVRDPLTLTGGGIGTFPLGASMSHSITASGGQQPYSYAAYSGVPPGLTVSSLGVLSGTPTTAGSYSMNVAVTDQIYGYQMSTFTITISSSLAVTLSGVSTVTANAPVSGQAGASGSGPFTFAISSGSLPAGVTLSAQGVLSGAPTQAGTFNFDVRATNQSSQTGTASFSWTVNPPLQVQFANVPSVNVMTRVEVVSSVSGGTFPYSCSVVSGTVASGLFVESDCSMSGRLSTVGTYNFQLRLSDSGGASATQSYSVTVRPALRLLPSGMVGPATQGTPFSIPLQLEGGDGTETYSTGSQVLPAGLQLNGAAISGTPQTAGTFSFGVSASLGEATASTNITLTVNPKFEFIPPANPTATVGTGFTWTPQLRGGLPPYIVAIAGTSLPAGLSLDRETGVITGTPQTQGTLAFSIEAFDQNNAHVQHYVQIDVQSPIDFNPQIPKAVKPNELWAITLEASRGTAPYTYAVTSGSLPAGVVLSEGKLTGAATTKLHYSFTLTATDAKGLKSDRKFAVSVTDGIMLSPSSLRFVVVPGVASAPQLVKLDSNPVLLEAVAGELPAWLKLSADRSVTPGAINVTASAASTMAPGKYQSKVLFRVAGLEDKELSVEMVVQQPSDLTHAVSLFIASSESPMFLVRSKVLDNPYRARLEGPGASSFVISTGQTGAFAQSLSSTVWLQPAQDRSKLALETYLVVESTLTNESTRVLIPSEEISKAVVNTMAVSGSVDEGINVSSWSVLLKTQSGPRRYATIASQPWVEVSPATGDLTVEQALTVTARHQSLPAGTHRATIRIYLEDGKEATGFDVYMVISGVRRSANAQATLSRQVFDAAKPRAELVLTNPLDRSVPFAVRPSASQVDVATVAGELAPGETRSIAVTASAFSQPESLFVSFGDGQPVVMDVFWLAKQKNCAAQPALEWVTPSRGSTQMPDQSVAVQALLTNGCGEALTSGAMAVVDEQGVVTPLLSSVAGLWTGHWTAGASEGDSAIRALELIYSSPDGKQQLQKQMSVAVKQ